MRRKPLDPCVAQGELRVRELRLLLMGLYPFWGTLVAEVQFLWAADLPAFAATDGLRRIWLNPKWIQHLHRRQLGFVVLHELGHIVLETIARREARDRRLWNIATDYAINRQVEQMPARGARDSRRAWEAPRGEIAGLGVCEPLFDPAFDHLPAEAIYARLCRNSLPDGLDGLPVDLPDGHGRSVRSQPRHGGGVDVHVSPEGDPHERQADRDRAAVRLERAAIAARETDGDHDLPLGVDRWLAARKTPSVGWQALLQRYLQGVGATVERSWARPHRRWLAEGWLVPGVVPERDGTVVLAIDTSGSMDTERLAAIAAELQALGDLVDELWVVVADAAVHEVVAPGDLPAFLARRRWSGGGGTDHRPVFRWLEERRIVPELLMCCTDLFTKLPVQAPGYPVLWLVMPDEAGRRGPRPGFGEVVVVDHPARLGGRP